MRIRPLRVVAALHLGEEVPRPHTRHAHDLTTTDGERWVAKSVATIKASGLRAEAIAALAAQVVGAPVPEGAVCDIDGVRWWCSRWVAGADPWSAEGARDLSSLGDGARIVLLDLLVGNEDRHRDNMLLARTDAGATRLVAIDHEQAWAGHEGALEVVRSPDLDKYPEDFAEHRDVVEAIGALALAVAAEPLQTWREVAVAAASVAPGTNSSRLADGLHRRAQALPALASAFLRGHRITP